MNIRQKVALLLGGLAFLVIGLYPPWLCRFSGHSIGNKISSGDTIGPSLHYNAATRPIGHHLIFRPPASSDSAYYKELFGVSDNLLRPFLFEFKIDVSRLLIFWACIGVATFVLVILFHTPKQATH